LLVVDEHPNRMAMLFVCELYIYIYIYLGKFEHDLTVLPNPEIMVYFRGIIPIHGHKIQDSEIL